MEFNELVESLHKKTRDELASYIPIAPLIVNDEFNRPTGIGLKEYRNRAIDRLIKMNVPFSSEGNILSNMTRRFVNVLCPYCKTALETKSSSGNSDTMTQEFACPCGAKVNIVLRNDAIQVTPPG